MPKTVSAPARRRDQLSRARVLATALELVDQDGLEALTMRRLADQLRVDPMSIYNHVDGKDSLLDGLAEALWDQVEAPSRKSDWKAALRSLATSFRNLAHVHPHAHSLLFGRGLLPEPALRAFDASLAAVQRAGLDRQAAAESSRHCSPTPSAMGCWSCRPLRCLARPSWSGC